MSDSIRESLEAARQELLDLGLRNPLLNHRELKSRGLRIVDERSEQVFRMLVENEAAMSFLPSSEEEDDESLDTREIGFEQPVDEEEIAPRHKDKKLQTSYVDRVLQRRLLNTYYTARTHIQERGVNVLYITLGELRWFEDPASDTERRAPLVLVPVELDRANVKSRFQVRYTGADFGSNHSLEVKLGLDMGIKLPSYPLAADTGLLDYFDQVAATCANFERWSVESHSIRLGFYSFLRLLMYEDLDPDNWPEDRKPFEDEMLRKLLADGFESGPLPIGSDEPLDPKLDPLTSFQVVDADSSQTTAIENVLAGRDLVIQGPPGTGKSQTICNLIAEALARGKKVLFVAEKLAALEVVRRRLEAIGLGDVALELHGHWANKKEFLREMDRTLKLGAPTTRDRRLVASEVQYGRRKLNAYADAVNEPIGTSGVTPIEAYGNLCELTGNDESWDVAEIQTQEFATWDKSEFERLRGVVSDLQSLVSRMGVPVEHPFWGSAAESYVPTIHKHEIQRSARDLLYALDALQRSSGDLADLAGLSVPDDLDECEAMVRVTRTILDSPDLSGIDVKNTAWLKNREKLEVAIQVGGSIREIRHEHPGLMAHAWESSVLDLWKTVSVYGSRWWRLFSAEYRKARRELTTLWEGKPPKESSEQLLALDAILTVHRLRDELSRLDELLKELYGDIPGEESDRWFSLRNIFEYLANVHAEIARRSTPPEVLETLAAPLDRDRLQSLLENLEKDLERVQECLDAANAAARMPTGAGQRESKLSTDVFEELKRCLDAWVAEPGLLKDVAAFNVLTERLSNRGLDRLVQFAESWEGAGSRLETLFRIARYSALIEVAFQQRKSLTAFDGSVHEETIRRFRKADQDFFETNRLEVLRKHWNGLPPMTGVGQVGTLLHEIQKKARHLPIRRLMIKSGKAIQAIKPVFMMSPLSIAAYLPPASVDFDLVIFDEASQVRPVDAFGALLRGRQAVVVGDSKQLPPTTFFSKTIEAEEDEEWNDTVADLESVLGAFLAKGTPSAMLRWHYRSRHQSLIEVSNEEFYDGELKIFPSPDAHKEDKGLVFHHLPETHYERGRERGYNRGEARLVAQAVMDHAINRPDASLGVAAFSRSQMQAVLDELELLRREDSSCESFFGSHPEEPFFVKNLENVQGDERDVIFLSVGYGRTEEGDLSMNFGPLNKAGGERRLNVLITRARSRCEVFSNLTADDIDLSRTSARGVEAFRRYLRFAELGLLEQSDPRSPEDDLVFETHVARAIRAHGFEVRQQVGSVGFHLDLAVVDPEQPGRFILGIECDGAGYHKARWARDRDRIRPAVLEGLGWTIHRIWSTDWYLNPERELRSVLEAVEKAKLQTSPEPDSSSESFEVSRKKESTTEREGGLFRPYELCDLSLQLGGRPLHRVPAREIAGWVGQVVDTEGPVHRTEVARRISMAAGNRQVGSRIRTAIHKGISAAQRRGKIRVDEEDFVWPAELVAPVARDRSEIPASMRKFELISSEEIEMAVCMVVENAFGAETHEVVPTVCRELGFLRTSRSMADRVEKLIENLLEQGKLGSRNGHLRLPG